MRYFDRARVVVPVIFLAILVGLVPGMARGQEEEEPPAPAQAEKRFSEGELDQMLAPIALYPDDLLSQVLMASTYPLEVVQAARWVKSGSLPKGDKLAEELEKKEWEPSVKSLVNFPDVLQMMDERLEWTQKLGNAFLAQEEEVMDAVQRLRRKAHEEGNLESTKEQKVVVEEKIIVIESADPKVVYVPVYNTTVVYGTWPYPAYPPYYYYPPRYPRPTLYGFAAGVTIGLAWGYAWGRCSWHRSCVNVNINRNVNINGNINRDRYRRDIERRGGSSDGRWQHNPQHRRGVSYPDRSTAQRYRQGPSGDPRSRDAYRGRRDATRPTTQPTRPATRPTTQPSKRPAQSSRPSAQPSRSSNAFGGYSRGSDARRQSSRGQSSRQSYQRSSRSRSAGGARGGGRSGGGRR